MLREHKDTRLRAFYARWKAIVHEELWQETAYVSLFTEKKGYFYKPMRYIRYTRQEIADTLYLYR